MAGRILNPFNGPVKVYVKALPESGTNDPVTGNAIVFTSWTDLGYQYQSEDGVTVSIKTDVDEVKVMGFNTPIQRVIKGESATVSVKLLTASWEKIAAWGAVGMNRTAGVVGTGVNKITIGGKNYASEFSLAIDGVNDLGYQTCLYVPKVTADVDSNFNFKRGGDTSYEYKFNALASTALASGAQLLTIYEVTGASAIDPETL